MAMVSARTRRLPVIFGLVPETVRLWVAAAKKQNPGQTVEARDSVERARVSEMERRIRELESENAFLKKLQPSSRENSGKRALRVYCCGEGCPQCEDDVCGHGCFSFRFL